MSTESDLMANMFKTFFPTNKAMAKPPTEKCKGRVVDGENKCHCPNCGEKRFFCPVRTDDLKPDALPWVGKWVTVESWHTNYNKKYPLDEIVGFVKEMCFDIPESELLLIKPPCPTCRGEGVVDFPEAVQAWDVPGAPIPEGPCPTCQKEKR